MLTPTQIRMARAGLGWSAADLAARAAVSQRTVQHIETGTRGGQRRTWAAIEAALEAGGAEFLPCGGVRVSREGR